MGSAENKATTQAAYDGFVQGNMEPLMSSLADDVVWISHLSADDPMSGTYNGPAGVGEYFGKFGEQMEMRGFEVEELIAEGNSVAAVINVSSHNKATGEQFEGRAMHLLRFDDDGKLARWEVVRAH